MNRKLLLSSQSFGFGPSAELIRIAKGLSRTPQLRDSELVVYDTPEIQTILADTNNKLRRTTEDDGKDVLEFLKQHGSRYGFDAIFSSYDAAPIFYGWFHGIPCFFYDGMLSFWNVDSFKPDINQNLRLLQQAKEAGDEDRMVQIYRQITAKNHHESIFLAYFLATRNFARGGDSPERQLASFVKLQKKTKIIGGIMDPDTPYDPSIERDHVLVSLSASLVPTVTFEQNVRFAINTINFVKDIYKETPDINWIVSVNPKILEWLKANGYLSSLPRNLEVRQSFHSEENLRYIRGAKVLLISPGFSSIHEAAYYRTPVVFLPEQNNGQPVGYTKLRKEGYPKLPNLTFAENIGGSATMDFDEFRADELYYSSDKLYRNPEFEAIRTAVKKTIIQLLDDLSFASEVGQKQHRAISHITGGFNGVEEITKDVLARFES